MTRSGIYRAQTTCGDVSNPVRINTTAATVLAFAVKGELTVADQAGSAIVTPAGALAVLQPTESQTLSFKGLAFIVVEILGSNTDP